MLFVLKNDKGCLQLAFFHPPIHPPTCQSLARARAAAGAEDPDKAALGEVVPRGVGTGFKGGCLCKGTEACPCNCVGLYKN